MPSRPSDIHNPETEAIERGWRVLYHEATESRNTRAVVANRAWCAQETARHRAEPEAEPDPDPEAEPDPDPEADADWADEWDSADAHAYMDRVEAGLEPEAEL